MTNPRDTGRYDAFTDSYIDQNVRVDFAWGNLPMQPNDDRGMAQLDPELDSHIIATSGYEGFPAFIQGEPYDDTVPNAVMPNLYGMNQVQAETALADAGFSSWINNQTTSGATSQNNNTVSSQYPGAGELLNVDAQPAVVYYNYSSPINHTIAGIRKNFNGSDLPYNEFYMFLQGQNHGLINGSVINITGSDVAAYNKNGWIVIAAENDNAFNTGGTKVTIFWNGAITETANGTGGTYTKVS